MGKGERVALRLSTLVAAGALAAGCSGNPGKVDTSASASPSRPAATATGATRTGEATPGVSASAGTPGPRADRPPFTLPIVAGAGINVADCPAVAARAQVEAPAPSGSQIVKLTADQGHPGLTFINGTNFTAISADRRERVMVEGQTLDVNVGGTETQQPLNGEPVIVRQNVSGNNLINDGSGAPATACGRGPNALPTFEGSVAESYRGPVLVVIMNRSTVNVTPGRV